MLEISAGISGGDRTQRVADGVDQRGLRAGLCGAQMLFELGPHVLDGVEVVRVRRQVQQVRPGFLDRLADGLDPVGTRGGP